MYLDSVNKVLAHEADHSRTMSPPQSVWILLRDESGRYIKEIEIPWSESRVLKIGNISLCITTDNSHCNCQYCNKNTNEGD